MVDQHRASIPPPVSLLAELTHRCPLQCPYCSNPLELERAARELDTATWRRVLDEATALGVLQTHFSGGEPTARRDLVDLVRHAAGLGQYTNLITSGVLLDQAKLDALVEAGLDHLQLSIQDSRAGKRRSDRRLPQRPRQEDGAGRDGQGGRAAADDQRGGPSPEPRPSERDHRSRGRTRRAAARGRPCPVPRLGAREPRRADADPGAGRARDRAGHARRASG